MDRTEGCDLSLFFFGRAFKTWKGGGNVVRIVEGVVKGGKNRKKTSKISCAWPMMWPILLGEGERQNM